MTEKNIKSRITHKHDTEANWQLAVNFIPKQGEIIVYDEDENYSYSRFKIGNGVSNVNDLPFSGGNSVEVDTSLTQEGMAADSKAVGDAIKSLSTVVAVDDGEGNIELKPFLTHEALISEVLVGEY